MSRAAKRNVWVVSVVVTAMAVGTIFTVVADPRAASTPREIVLVARHMAFYQADDPTPNPTLAVSPDERIRLVFRNEDAGMTHNFTIEPWKIATPRISGADSASIEFTVPAARGRYQYACTPHAQMMRGVIEIR